jgi:hypothetical protein
MVLVTQAPEATHLSPDNKKKTTLETSHIKDAGHRRLVEYFVVVSSVPHDNQNSEDHGTEIHRSASFEASRNGLSFDDDEDIFEDDFNFQPKITARFPLQDHEENPLHESVTFFCYPSGTIQLRLEMTMPKVSLENDSACYWLIQWFFLSIFIEHHHVCLSILELKVTCQFGYFLLNRPLTISLYTRFTFLLLQEVVGNKCMESASHFGSLTQ